MTEVHAFRADLAGERQGSDGAWPSAVEATDPADGAENAVALAPPVPAPGDQAGLVAEDGTRLVAGLAWEIASGPESPVLRKGARQILRLPTRRARLADAGSGPCGSLLLQMGADLTTVHFPAATGPWAFIAEIPQPDAAPSIWMALADIAATGESDRRTGGEVPAVTPRPGPELTFQDPEDALGTLEELLGITDIAGIAVRWLPIHPGMKPEDTHRGRMVRGIAEISETVRLHDVGPDVPPPPGFQGDAASVVSLPVFAPPRQLPARLLAGLGIVGAATVAGFFVVMPLIEEALRPKPLPPPEMVTVQIAPGAFADACRSALDAWWPRVTGWRLDSAGCALGGYLPGTPGLPEPQAADGRSRAMVVWRHLLPEAGRNIILLRAAADRMLDTWPHEARRDENTLTLWSTVSLPLVPVEGAGAARQGPDAIRERLAALWAHAPDAVTLLQESRGLGLVRIATAGGTPAGESLSRAGTVPGIAPVRLVEAPERAGELVVGPVTLRELPVTMFGSSEGGRSQ